LESGAVTRLDIWLVEHGHFTSRQIAKRAIKAGLITVDGKSCKPSTTIRGTESVEVLDAFADTSRGFQKLQAIDRLLDGTLVFQGGFALDIGSSAGGFLSYLARKGMHAVGIEVSERFLKNLELLVEENDGISVVIADAFDVDPFTIAKSSTLDLLLIDVTTDPQGTLELAETFTPLLKPGGQILVALKSSQDQGSITETETHIRGMGYKNLKSIILDAQRKEFHVTGHRL
jgi:23S rRNA (cytidine1920-2'-O)/16S rRNA (cytidine1409-2'-O)-methyltransferase